MIPLQTSLYDLFSLFIHYTPLVSIGYRLKVMWFCFINFRETPNQSPNQSSCAIYTKIENKFCQSTCVGCLGKSHPNNLPLPNFYLTFVVDWIRRPTRFQTVSQVHPFPIERRLYALRNRINSKYRMRYVMKAHFKVLVMKCMRNR